LRRASVSIGSNIAEGFGRWTPRDQARFYEIAKGSAEEIRHLLIVCSQRRFLKVAPGIDRQIDAVCGMLFNLRPAVLRKSQV
jgi:four helix bundle protein